MRQPAAGHAPGLRQRGPLRGWPPDEGVRPVEGGPALALREPPPRAGLRTQRLGRPLVIGGCDPDDHAVALRAGAGGRCGGEIDGGLRELAVVSATAPRRSSPWMRNARFTSLSVRPARSAGSLSEAGSSGTRSICDWPPPRGNPRKASRFTPLSLRAERIRWPSAGVSGTVT